MPHVRIAVYALQKGTTGETLQRAQETAFPLYRQRPGFVAYELFQTGDDSIVSVTTWETHEQAEAACRVDDQWIAEHGFTTVMWVQEHVGSVSFSSPQRRT